MASAAAKAAMTVCVISISLRRSYTSAATPLSSEKQTIGSTRTSPTIPSASARLSSGTSSDTCHRIAADCIRLPEKEISRPIRSRRKLRCRSETKLKADQPSRCLQYAHWDDSASPRRAHDLLQQARDGEHGAGEQPESRR